MSIFSRLRCRRDCIGSEVLAEFFWVWLSEAVGGVEVEESDIVVDDCWTSAEEGEFSSSARGFGVFCL